MGMSKEEQFNNCLERGHQMALEVESGTFAEEIVSNPPSSEKISLKDLIYGIYGNKDLCLGSRGPPPFEQLDIQNGCPSVNEEFIFMTESQKRCKGHLGECCSIAERH